MGGVLTPPPVQSPVALRERQKRGAKCDDGFDGDRPTGKSHERIPL